MNWVLSIRQARRSERAKPFPSSLWSLAGDFARVPSTAAHDLTEEAERPARMPDSSEGPLSAPAPITPKPGGVPRRGNARAGTRTLMFQPPSRCVGRRTSTHVNAARLYARFGIAETLSCPRVGNRAYHASEGW